MGRVARSPDPGNIPTLPLHPQVRPGTSPALRRVVKKPATLGWTRTFYWVNGEGRSDMQRKTKSERAEARSFGQVFRDTATLLLLVLLAVSVRLDGNEGQAAVEPLPGGLQAAEVGEFAAPAEPAASPAVEFAVEPAVACPKSRPAAGPASRIIPASS